MTTTVSYKLLSYNVYDETKIIDKQDNDNTDEIEIKKFCLNKEFIIQMFGINELGLTACIFVKNFKPFFYIKIDCLWTNSIVNKFISKIKDKIGQYYEDSIISYKVVEKKTLYSFNFLNLAKVSAARLV